MTYFTTGAARAAYRANTAGIHALGSARSAEYEVFSRVTARLTAAARDKNQPFAKLAEALHENRKLWTLLATDVAHPDNKLPNDLKQRIFSLAYYVAHHSGQVLSGAGSTDPLIELNLTIMRGLTTKDGEA